MAKAMAELGIIVGVDNGAGLFNLDKGNKEMQLLRFKCKCKCKLCPDD